MSTSISLLTEIPEELHESLQHYLDSHPNWDQDKVFAVALSMFLLQTERYSTAKPSRSYKNCAKVYLENLFQLTVSSEQ